MPRKRIWLTAAAGLIAGAGVYFGSAAWKADTLLRRETGATAAEGMVRFQEVPLDSGVVPPGYEAIGAPASFRGGAAFRGRVYLAGLGGLVEFESDGTPARVFRPGLELPSAPLHHLITAAVGPSGEPDLWASAPGEGLIRFDGSRLTLIRPEEPKARKITALLAAGSGRLLVGTEKLGVLRFDGARLGRFHPSLDGTHVTALAGEESDFWIGTIGGGALHWQGGRLERFSENEGLPDRQVTSIALDGPAAYVGTPLGVAEIRAGKVVRVVAPGYLAQSLAIRGGRLLVGTAEEGIVEAPLQAASGRARRAAQSCGGCSVSAFFATPAEILAVTPDRILRVGADSAPAALNVGGAAISDRNVSALALDSTGRLWIGYFDRGLDIWDAPANSVRHIENERIFCVNRIVPDADRGEVLVATANGLAVLDALGTERRFLTKADGLIANHVTDIAARAGGGWTIATPAGITLLDPRGASSLYAFHGLVNNHAYSVASSGATTLVGTLGGLSLLDGDAITASYTTANSALRHNWISALARDGDGWLVGTYGAGVMRFTPDGQWREFPDWRNKGEVNPNAMAATARGVYAGTLGQGIAIYHRESRRWSFSTSGLPSRNVTAIQPAGEYLYVGTDNGLVRIREDRLQ
ncbi:MAG: hypothetical protein K2X35_24865 [Bryobacteraceae bacterium]|nr:hypothetical protein [Bryobacteraceae bacterium]